VSAWAASECPASSRAKTRQSPRRGPLRFPERPAGSDVARWVGGLGLLVALNRAGEWLVGAAHVPIPGSVVGMLALTALIELGVLPLRLIRPAAELLVRHLALLYVPAGVALIAYVAVVRQDLLAIAVAALASLVAVLAVVGVLVQRLAREP
jgi:holin-like protein